VDDRFRPIQLTQDPEGEFAAAGFVLLQETGEQTQTNGDGEFVFSDLEPGQYTLRVQAEGHEATPQKIGVTAGRFSEATLTARRVVSEGSFIITDEYSAFSPCFINFVALSYTADCTADQSGETARLGIMDRNVTNIDNVTWVVTEALFNQEPQGGAAYDVVVRRELDHDYAAAVLFEGRYAKLHMQNGSVSPDEPPAGEDFHPWYVHNGTFDVLMFGRGYGAEEIRTAYEPVYETLQDAPCIPTGLGICVNDIPMRRGAGGTLGNEAKFLVSIFVGEPEVDPLVYCALCEPA
jgi:hypothetical protein